MTESTLQLAENADGMDKIVGCFEEATASVLNTTDAMELIVSTQPDQDTVIVGVLNVETALNDKRNESASPDQDLGLNVETIQLKMCHVCVRPLENILFDDAK